MGKEENGESNTGNADVLREIGVVLGAQRGQLGSRGVQATRAPDLASTLGAPRDAVDIVSRRVLHGDHDDVAF